MRKILLYIFVVFSLIGNIKLHAQNDINPEPTTSSIQSYIKYKTNLALGIPSVDIPLYNLRTNDPKTLVDISLSYHLYNSRSVMAPTEVGWGWTLNKGAIISKAVGGNKNEFTEISNLTKDNSDRFFYSIPRFQGEFQIYNDTITGELKLFDLSGNNLKFEFVRDQTSTKLIINSFKITDDRGIIYNFNVYNITSFQTHYLQDLKNQRTAYLPTTISDAKNRALVTYSYDVKTKTTLNPYGSTAIKYKVNKLNTMTTSHGKIKFEYDYNENADNNNQNKEYYTINNITLLTTSDKQISKFKLTIDPLNGLNSLKKNDSNNIPIENTIFGYDYGSDTQYGYIDENGISHFGEQLCLSYSPFINPQKYVYRVLKSITFPTRGRVEYAYEANEVYKDYSSKEFENAGTYTDPFNQFYETTDNISFDTNITRDYTFTVHGTPGTSYPVMIEKDLENGIDYQQGHPISFNFSISNSNNQIVAINNSQNACPSSAITKHYRLSSGTYTIKINGWAGNGKFRIVELKSVQKPYKNVEPVPYGARVKTITYYDDFKILKQIKYLYNSFIDPLSSSGSLIDNPDYPYVLYKNVREIEITGNENNGYTDYYYKTPYEYFEGLKYPYSNLTSHGVLTQKKIYNSQNELLINSEYDYIFTEIPNATTLYDGSYRYIPSYISYKKEIKTQKFGNSNFIMTNESTYSPFNFQEVSSKISESDGNIKETITKYAQDISDIKLVNANMISVPLETVSKVNGSITSSDKVQYDDPNHFYPTSQISHLPDDLNVTVKNVSYDIYDDKRNLVQFTALPDVAGGNPTTIIWGYNKTTPIAKIEGAKLSDIPTHLITLIVNASDADGNSTTPAQEEVNEKTLIDALNTFRTDASMQNFVVTCYTYNPLIGLTNTIPPTGIMETYIYDSFNRLKKVVDVNGKTLKEYNYNYRQ